MKNVYEIISELIKKGEECALCTIISTKGSTPLKTGSKMIVTSKGEIYGTIGGGDLEKSVIENAVSAIKLKHSEQFTHNLLQQHGMCCGGSVIVFIDYIKVPDKLYIFGSGHVGRALANSASQLDFDIYVIDDRKNELDKLINHSVHKLPYSHKEIMKSLPFDEHTFICIMTRDHAIDREILAFCVNKPSAYLGMIGSKRKVEITRKMFISGGICDEEEFNKVNTPMGYDIKAHSPEEIAISILAKLIEVKNSALKNLLARSGTAAKTVEL